MTLLRSQGPFAPLRVDGVVFDSVMTLPARLPVYDFTGGAKPSGMKRHQYGIGRYDEHRPNMYLGSQFSAGQRDIHMGIDIGAPAHSEVRAFYSGRIFKLGDNAAPYDYGPTIITEHHWLSQTIYALHGHLSRSSLRPWCEGDLFESGAVLGYLGQAEENGGWPPHLHFQLSLAQPDKHDLPGVVSKADRPWARTAFPDPRLVLGPLYGE